MVEKYSDMVNRSWDDIPVPQLLPRGSWLLRGNNVAFFPHKDEEEAKKGCGRVAFFYVAKEPMEDVSEQELAALGNDYSYADNDIVAQFFINRNKDWDAVRKHLELHGISTAGKTQPETFDAFKGTEVVAFLEEDTYTNGQGQTITQNKPTNFAAV